MVELCCSRTAFYNIRRYDPIGRTMWVRDYFAGSTGQHADPFPLGCRLCVDSANDLIFVTGPLVWENEEKPRTWWNIACYTTGGGLLWRKRLGRDDNSGGALDVIVVNGHYYAMVEEIEPVGFPPLMDGISIVEFDRQGRQLQLAFGDTFQIGTRFLAGNPEEFYRLPPFDGSDHGPKGITTFLWSTAFIARSAAYFPETDDFVIGVPPPNTGAVFDIIWRSTAEAVIAGGNGIINNFWPVTSWAIQNAPGDLFASPAHVWVIPEEMSPAPNGDVFCAAQTSTYYLYEFIPTEGGEGEGTAVKTPLGTGSIVRLSGETGLPVWMRGIASAHCIASDNAGRLYAGRALGVASDGHPTIQRWSQDGEFIWGHHHNAINQVALVDDRGTVTLGTRVQYGVSEKNWITEGSFGE